MVKGDDYSEREENGVTYADLIKELIAERDELKAENERLKAENARLMAER